MIGAHTASPSRAPRTIPFADSRSPVTTMSLLRRDEDARDEDAVVGAWKLIFRIMSAVAMVAGICSPRNRMRDLVWVGDTPARRGCITEYCALLSVRFEAVEQHFAHPARQAPDRIAWEAPGGRRYLAS